MADSLIHDRGRGPELIGTRVTVYNLIPYFLDPTATEAEVCELLRLTPTQVAAARAYVVANHVAVMAEHERIEERIRRGIEAQDTPEFRERRKETRENMELFRRWLTERDADTVSDDREARMRFFRQWAEEQATSPAGGS